MMKISLLFCLLSISFLEIEAWRVPGFRLRFGITGIGTTSFIDLPQNSTCASNNGWTQMNRTSRHSSLSSLVLWCPADSYIYCVYYDDLGYAAGLQFAIAESNCTNVFNMTQQGYDTWTVTIDGEDTKFYTISQYYVSDGYLSQSSTSRSETRNSSVLIQDANLWLDWFNGELFNVSQITDYFTGGNSLFTKQRCVFWMGTHYYYNMSSTTECKADKLSPWFPLVDGTQLIGVGFTFFCDVISSMYETPGTLGVEYIVEDGPTCLDDLASTQVMTLHTYFIARPWNVLTC